MKVYQRYTAWKHHSIFLGVLALDTICCSFVQLSKGFPTSSSAARRRSSKVGIPKTLLDKVMQVSTKASVTCQVATLILGSENRQKAQSRYSRDVVGGVSES